MEIFHAELASKQIDGIKILQDITLSISQGEKVGIVGSNGSGKSSLLKLIGGIYEENTGKVKRAQIGIGYVPEHFPENIRFNIWDYLILMGKMNGTSKEELMNEIKKYAEIFAITDFLHTPLKKCSKGTKQKVGVIQALLKNPDLLLLDEPLTGLDEKSQHELLEQLTSLQKEITIIFTVHEPLLIEGLADRVIGIEAGKIFSDSPNTKRENVRMIMAIIPNKEEIVDIPHIKLEFAGEHSVEIIIAAKDSDQVLRMLLERGCSIVELKEKR